MACKSEVADTVVNMVQDIKNLLNSKMREMTCIKRYSFKWIRTNGTGEYIVNKFQEWVWRRSIKHEVTMSSSPNFNGAVKRLHQMLLDMTRTMLWHLNEPRHYLRAETINTACVLRNRLHSPSCAIRRTSYEIINSKRSRLGYCKIFGSWVCVFRDRNPRQGNIDLRADVGMILGCDRGHTYRVSLDENDTIVVPQNMMTMKLKEQGERTVLDINMMEFDLGAAKIIFDDEHPQQGEQENVFDSDTAEAEDGDCDEGMQIEVDAGINLDDLTCYSNKSCSEQQRRKPQSYGFEGACVSTDIKESGDITTFYGEIVGRSDSAR